MTSMSERDFCLMWCSLLWNAMLKTQKGYRKHTLKNRPPDGAAMWRGERRKDKQRYGTKLERRLMGVFA